MTEGICSVCYVKDNLVSRNEIRANYNLGGQTPLIMCRACLDSGVDVPYSGTGKNIRQAECSRNKRKRKGGPMSHLQVVIVGSRKC